MTKDETRLSPFMTFSRAEWSRLRDGLPLLLSEAELARLRGLNDDASLGDVADIYLPLARLLQLHIAAAQQLAQVVDAFIGAPTERVPYVIGVAGSVAVGKSTTARILQELLRRSAGLRVDLVTTDGFLLPNRVLEERGIMQRKGFPESYDRRALLRFVAEVKSGRPELRAPVYSHLTYDIVPDDFQLVDRPDVLIVEGLNVLQRGADGAGSTTRVFVSDYFDFSIYVDAATEHLERWYIERFLRLRETAFRNKASYFHRYASLSVAEAIATARSIWRSINEVNLRENILPTRGRARLILEKGENHSLQQVRLRK
ncbi:MAG TPA: type I pantothenate kinase [Roseiflexaceae bacterium]|nr:type I pantothenate kinase [Roseiflexaceae bacterium]